MDHTYAHIFPEQTYVELEGIDTVRVLNMSLYHIKVHLWDNVHESRILYCI